MSDVSLNLIFPNLAEDEDDVEEDVEAAVTEEEDEEEEEETFSDTLTATVSVPALAATMNRCLAAATAPEVTGVKEVVEEVEDGVETDMEGVEGLEAEVEVGAEGLEARVEGREGGVFTLSAYTFFLVRILKIHLFRFPQIFTRPLVIVVLHGRNWICSLQSVL